MNKRLCFIFVAMLLLTLGVSTVSAEPSTACNVGNQSSGAIYQICMPDFVPYNGTLLLYAHGYVNPDEPLALPTEAAQIAAYANAQGYAFATTSYSRNGLAVREGIADILDLVDLFTTEQSAPNNVYLTGFSEGALITTLAIEENPTVFDAGLAMCGPLGDYNAQTAYFGDARVLFDYFFPNVIPGSPTDIPAAVQADWDTLVTTTIVPTLSNPANLTTVAQYLAVAGIPYDTTDPTTAGTSIVQVLSYGINSTNDAAMLLGGNPYDNQTRVYAGSADDTALNAGVARISADAAALATINAGYQTTGNLAVPLVTLHTLADPVVPAWHNALYEAKVTANSRNGNYSYIPIARYGHCTFEQTEVITALGQMVARAEQPPTAVSLASQPTSPASSTLVAVLGAAIAITTATILGVGSRKQQ